MPTLRARILARICLILAPFIYILGIELYHHESFLIIGKFLIFGWMLVSLAVGIATALTYRLQIFGLNCGLFLMFSVPIMVISWTLQVNGSRVGVWIMYSYFVSSFLYGCFTLIMVQKKRPSQ
jgi:hypothetical protein